MSEFEAFKAKRTTQNQLQVAGFTLCDFKAVESLDTGNVRIYLFDALVTGNCFVIGADAVKVKEATTKYSLDELATLVIDDLNGMKSNKSDDRQYLASSLMMYAASTLVFTKATEVVEDEIFIHIILLVYPNMDGKYQVVRPTGCKSYAPYLNSDEIYQFADQTIKHDYQRNPSILPSAKIVLMQVRN